MGKRVKRISTTSVISSSTHQTLRKKSKSPFPKLPPKETQNIISTYHTLQKRIESLNKVKQNSLIQSERIQKQLELESIGGIDLYQHASKLGQSSHRGGGSEKWLLKQLNLLKLSPPSGQVNSLRIEE